MIMLQGKAVGNFILSNFAEEYTSLALHLIEGRQFFGVKVGYLLKNHSFCSNFFVSSSTRKSPSNELLD